MNQLKILQNKAIKFILKLPCLEPTINLYTPKKLLDINNIYKYKICCFIFSVLHKQKNSNTKFTYNNLVHNHNTRQIINLALINIKSNFGAKSVHFQGIQVYNNLQQNLKSLSNIKKFKNKKK